MDRLLFGLGVALVGMVIVFIGLAFLILCIHMLKRLSREKNSPAAKIVAAAPVHETNDLPLSAIFSAVAAVMNQEEQEQLVAVITAAVAAQWEAESSFVVRRIRRISTSPAWQKAGREEQVYSHM